MLFYRDVAKDCISQTEQKIQLKHVVLIQIWHVIIHPRLNSATQDQHSHPCQKCNGSELYNSKATLEFVKSFAELIEDKGYIHHEVFNSNKTGLEEDTKRNLDNSPKKRLFSLDSPLCSLTLDKVLCFLVNNAQVQRPADRVSQAACDSLHRLLRQTSVNMIGLD
ncbi:hypothetical protein NPIL_644781 [Nephila pilipes]|uniref:Uncharacterized protein n=1 Tax=Nephila pilipes TaxID=299642 RepID=A0A8X6NB36_NEPPI|nr:hypothetical protein NPIL_644781 [Nephila pilipes]